MPTITQLPPKPGIFLENIRHMGYTLKSAIADVIDNSIAAGAKHVSLKFDVDPKPWIAICDDGDGMDKEELIRAMNFGSRALDTPLAGSLDLGRFGLGLKMASLSQCRRLVVCTRKAGKFSCAFWDIDALMDDWNVTILSEDDMDGEGFAQLRKLLEMHIGHACNGSGTIVLWENIDRDFARNGSSFSSAMVDVAEYLGLVFHCYLGKNSIRGKSVPHIQMDRNGNKIRPLPPFGPDNNFNRRQLETKQIALETKAGQQYCVTCVPYVLPSEWAYSNQDEYKEFATHAGYQAAQGFYVYRNSRLITWGTWFGLHPKEQDTQKLRILLDIPACADLDWGVDVRKSQILPPEGVKYELSLLIESCAKEARKQHRIEKAGNPRLLCGSEDDSLWILRDTPSGSYPVSCRHNPKHFLLKRLYGMLRDKETRQMLSAYLLLLESTYPVREIMRTVNYGPSEPATEMGQMDAELVGKLTELLGDEDDALIKEIIDSVTFNK